MRCLLPSIKAPKKTRFLTCTRLELKVIWEHLLVESCSWGGGGFWGPVEWRSRTRAPRLWLHPGFWTVCSCRKSKYIHKWFQCNGLHVGYRIWLQLFNGEFLQALMWKYLPRVIYLMDIETSKFICAFFSSRIIDAVFFGIQTRSAWIRPFLRMRTLDHQRRLHGRRETHNS